MFKAHVDTPRSDDQIGSLVAALPVDSEGAYSYTTGPPMSTTRHAFNGQLSTATANTKYWS